MDIKETQYLGREELFLYNHVVEKPYPIDSTASYVTTLANGRKVVKAGTVIPSNDANAVGICHWDAYLDENDSMTIVLHGFIKVASMPSAPSAQAKAALPQIYFQTGV